MKIIVLGFLVISTLSLLGCGAAEELSQTIDEIVEATFDLDNDGVENGLDNCPTTSNANQLDSNDNGVGDECDTAGVIVVEPEETVVLTEENTPEELINGYNANIVLHQNGAFVQLSSKQWVESGTGSSFTFTELRRDEWSVYLFDESRQVSIQLDLFRKEIIYSDELSRFPLYAITSVKPDFINGFSVSRVVYLKNGDATKGGFVQLSRSTWAENNTDGTFIFAEIGRDEWSVYLEDASRGVQIQLDLFTNEVKYTDSVNSFVLYPIFTAAPEKINAYVMREDSNDYASFLTTSAYEWVETSNDGAQYVYAELFRDEWSSILFDSTRDAYIQLDQHTGMINYHLGSDPFEPYLGVIPVVDVVTPDPVILPSVAPIAWYSFDAGTAADISGNGNHLNWGPGFVFQDAKGVEAEALYLSGDNTSAILPEGVVSDLSDFTISTFVKIEKDKVWSRIFDFGSGTSNYMFLTPSNSINGNVRFAIKADGSNEQIIEGDAPMVGDINGYNVKVVMHSTGAFVQLNAKDWVENGEGSYHTFKEVARDEWSVYLEDSSRGVSIQLDLHKKEVIYSDASSHFVLYAITTVKPEQINGYAVSRVRHSLGKFSQLSPTRWVEDNGVTSFAFTEVNRDMWSVYLYDTHRDISIQLDLFRKEIIYSDAEQKFVLYHITNTKPVESKNNWIHVAITKQGNVAKLYINGAVVGTNNNMTLSPADLGMTTQNWIGRSQFSSDPYFTGSIDEFRIYNRALAAKELKDIVGPDPTMITIMGTDVQLTPEAFEAELQTTGLTLVDADSYEAKGSLDKGECIVLYANADRDDISAELGMLTCSVELENGDIKLTTKLLYGGCDVSRLDQGIGSRCKVGLARDELRLRVSDNPAVYNVVSVAGPEAQECTAISEENTCFGLSANVASASYGWENENGTGLGAGVHVGVGAKGSAGYSDGVFKASISLKLGIGFSVDVSVSKDDVIEVFHLGETAWLENEDEIIAVGDKTAEAFEDFGNEVHDVGEKAVGDVKVAGETVVAYAENVGQSVVETYYVFETAAESAAEDVEEGIEDTAGVVAKGVSSFSGETVTFVGNTVEDVGDFFGF